MLMCHLWADSLDELLYLVDRIGVKRKWLQQPPKASWVHFDISKAKRILAVQHGAIECDDVEPLIHCAKLAGDTARVLRYEKVRKDRRRRRLLGD